jgi:uncharacterized OB-fold protein
MCDKVMPSELRREIAVNSTELPPLAPHKHYGTDENGDFVLIGSRCNQCGCEAFPPQSVCHECLSDDLDTFALPRSGNLYTYTTTSLSPLQQKGPVVLGFVDLQGGLRVFAQIEIKPDKVRCDLPVELVESNPIAGPDGRQVVHYKFAPSQ